MMNIETGSPFINILIMIFFVILLTYPVLGGIAWLTGVICYKFLYHYRQDEWIDIPKEVEPFITIMIPAHNEELIIEDTIHYMMNKLHYSKYEVLVMDDGSTDETPEILARLQKQYHNLRVVRIEKNKGKAHAFNIGVGFARGELILSNDADIVPEPNALKKYINYFIRMESRNIAAITSNAVVRNRSTLVGKSQTVEFASIVGIIKRTQTAVFGVIYAYSGANTMYKKQALIDAGLFRQNRATEDISIAWDHQLGGWLALFAEDIKFYMEVPETTKLLYKQRKRWAKGGTEVWLTNFKKVFRHPFRKPGRTGIYFDQSLSIIWTFFFWISSIIFFITMMYLIWTQQYQTIKHMLVLSGIFVCFEMVAGLSQIFTALFMDKKSRKVKYFIFAPLYLLFYWMLSAATIATTFFPAIKTILGYGTGVWKSPDRQRKIK
ncbi:glycosyltransferase family 2 protein [Listeria immobilis]|nr:glycosyltransferase family 2 protein [Listeria immobilis]